MERTAIALETAGALDEPVRIERVLAGDPRAARELYDAHAPRVYRLIFRLAGDADLAQELTQETFVRAFSRLRDFRGDAALSTWLHRIAVSVALNGMRKVKRFREREAPLEHAESIGARASGIDPDLRERLARAIDALPESLRVTLVMHDVEGYTHGEISAALEVPEGTCKTRLSAARAKIRQALAPFRKE
jgi:RNA polymerase sigma-70 factor (ECF subfamily)